ncbi:MAG TPA: GGDEF domain-containing protein, partial [Gemmatimonadaceae bacterium]|nr:GGDEF domain-containing protein [Gemmatimonadaceae bacterium]
MFFGKKVQDSHTDAADADAVARTVTDRQDRQPGDLRMCSPGDETTMVLDALGGVLQGVARFPIDLPHRSAEESTRLMTAWQRHATLGQPVDVQQDGVALPIGERDWAGLVRAVCDLRRDEQGSVDSIVSDLRAALWTCVAAVHEAVRIDDTAEERTGAQLSLVRRALQGTQMSNIKDEVLGALQEIDRTLKDRRDEQQRQYRALASSLDALGRQLEEAKKQIETDPMTGIGNRKHFDLMAMRSLQLFTLGRTPVTLLMVDLNKLKLINDSYGHTAGDHAIMTVAQALKLVFLRQSDVICRYGGDEFAVILNDCDMVVAQTLARRLLEMVRSLPSPAMEFALGASVGVAQLEPGEDVLQWIARADRAMYQAKRQPF